MKKILALILILIIIITVLSGCTDNEDKGIDEQKDEDQYNWSTMSEGPLQ